MEPLSTKLPEAEARPSSRCIIRTVWPLPSASSADMRLGACASTGFVIEADAVMAAISWSEVSFTAPDSMYRCGSARPMADWRCVAVSSSVTYLLAPAGPISAAASESPPVMPCPSLM